MLVLTATRAGLLGLYPEAFEGLSGGEVAAAFLRGLRFDLSAACTFAGLPLLARGLPLPWQARPLLRGFLGWAAFAGFLLLAFASAADLVYFGYVSRHVGPELAIAGDDLGQLVETAFSEYAPGVAGFAVLGAVSFLGWRTLLRRLPSPASGGGAAGWAVGLLHAFAIVSLARGGIGGNRLMPEDAFEGVPPAAMHLVLNGPYAAVQALVDPKASVEDFLERGEALRIARELVLSPAETAPDPEFPLHRFRAPSPGPRPNVVVVLLEGWSATTVDALRADRSLPPLGLTPRFEAFAGEGLLLRRMYAAGQRTRIGLTALLAGLPDLPGVPSLGTGLENWRLSYLGDLAKAEGYGTIFLMGYRADAQREADIVRAAGFDRVVAAEDVLGNNAGGTPVARDHELLEAASRHLREMEEPFLAFLHTASTHVPFARDDAAPAPFPDDSEEHRYWNTVAYADRALGAFVDRAKAEGWFERTLFVFVSDHIQRGDKGGSDPPALFHIPGLVVGPGVPRGVHQGIVSHTDVIPTIVHLAGWGAPYAAVGRSFLDDGGPHHGAQCATPSLDLRVEAGGWVNRSLKARRGAKGDDLDSIERRLLGTIEAARYLLLRNRLVPPR